MQFPFSPEARAAVVIKTVVGRVSKPGMALGDLNLSKRVISRQSVWGCLSCTAQKKYHQQQYHPSLALTQQLLPLNNHMTSQQASDLSNPFRQMTFSQSSGSILISLPAPNIPSASSAAELYHDFIALPYVQLHNLSPCANYSLNPVPPRLLTCRLLNRFRIFYQLTQPINIHPLRCTLALTHTLTHAHTYTHVVAYSPQHGQHSCFSQSPVL